MKESISIGLSALPLLFSPQALAEQTEPLPLEKDHHVVFIGNTFAERMQYFGEVEARLHARYPEHKLVVRNLGWSADTVSIRPRPKDFGDLSHYLKEMSADVILACFGFNETWDYDGADGISSFRTDLRKFLEELKTGNFSGEGSPEIVLYSPIACEGNSVPDAAGRNALLQLYTTAMAEVAAETGVHFVDLYAPSVDLFKGATVPQLTVNGVHLSAEGYAELAPAILPLSLFPVPETSADASLFDAIRTEVLEKNKIFFDWYRTVNSFYIHGDRRAPYGTVNFPAERKALLQMTAQHDARIWAAALGQELPETHYKAATAEIPRSLAGNRGGTSPALSPAEERAQFDVGEGFNIELFASEEDFPELRNPVAIKFDAEGRLWVATMPSYPHAFPGEMTNDMLLVLEDSDGDGKADQRTVFADGLYLPLGFELGHGGVFLSQEPNLVFLEDTDGDGKADKETMLLHGFGSEDSHHAIHNLVWGPGGGLFMSESVFHNTQVETNRGPRRSRDNAIYRFDPRTGFFDIAVWHPGGGNPWGHAIDRWGEHLFIGRHLNASMVRQPDPGTTIDADRVKADAPNNITNDTRFCGQEFIRSHHWPEEFQGKVFSNRYKDLQGTLVHDWTENGTTFKHHRKTIVFEANNKACIPVDLRIGPDGALYVVDWYNPVLGHMQYSLRDERRDTQLGRIWRITAKDRPLDTPAKVADASPEELLVNLTTYENNTRFRSRRLLWDLPEDTLRPALAQWIEGLDPSHPDHALHLTEALWLHQQRGWINPDLFATVATSSEPRARAAAARLLRFWADELPGARDHFARLAADDSQKVRLETVVSATWADPRIGAETLETVGQLPQDNFLKLAHNYASQSLAPTLQNHPLMMPETELAALPLNGDVIKAIIQRADLSVELREKALAKHATDRGSSPVDTLEGILLDLDQREEPALTGWLEVLDRHNSEELATLFTDGGSRPLLEQSSPALRQATFAAVVRSGAGDVVADDPDSLQSITRLTDDALKAQFLAPAKTALGSDTPELRRAGAITLGHIPGSDTEIFDLLRVQLATDGLADAAAASLIQRGPTAWPAKAADGLLTEHLPKLTATPVSERGSPAFIQGSAFLTALAESRSRPKDAAALAALQPRPLEITCVPDQLRFDKAELTVEAGTPIGLHFDNPDAIAHNLILCAPGSLEKVGASVDALLADPEAMARDWVPDLPEVLHRVPMVQAESSAVLRFKAPTEPGRYPYLCTVPGHWRVMHGYLVVTTAGTAAAVAPAVKEDSQVLILTGEPEYRSHESLAEIAKILEDEHGISTTQLSAEASDGTHRFPALNDHLPQADLVIFSARFLNLAEDQLTALDAHFDKGRFIAVRTSTHALKFPDGSPLADEATAFPLRHFGTPYRGHHGHKTSQINYVMAAKHPVMQGIAPRFWTPDFLYGVVPLEVACTPLMIGQALDGKNTASFRDVSPGNHCRVLSDADKSRITGTPHPVVWTVDNPDGTPRGLVTTIGARESFKNPNVQRLYLNAILWSLQGPTKLPTSTPVVSSPLPQHPLNPGRTDAPIRTP